MFQSEFDQFKALMSDLCTAFNRPYTDDVVRVFWDALKPYPFAQMRVRVKIATSGKKFPTPLDLTPEPQPQGQVGPTGPSNMDKLLDHLGQYYSYHPGARTWLGKFYDAPGIDGKMRHNHGCEITGVHLASCGAHAAVRVMMVDLQADQVA